MNRFMKQVCCGCFVTMMTLACIPSVHAAPAGWVEPPHEEPVKQEGKANIENLSLYTYDLLAYNGIPVEFDQLTFTGIYYLDYHDEIEYKNMYENGKSYYHTTFENLSPEIVEMSLGGELGGEPALKIESKDSGNMAHSGVALKGIKEGTAQIKCTIYDIENPDLSKTEIVSVVFAKENKDPKKAQWNSFSLALMGGEPRDFADLKNLDVNYTYDFFHWFTQTDEKYNHAGTLGYYHTTFENLTPDMIEIAVGGELGWEPATVIESQDTGMMRHDGISVKALKAGEAKIRYTVYDIENPEITKTEVIDLSFKGQETTNTSDATMTPEKPKHEVSYTGSKDILKNDDTLTETINMIQNAEGSAIINLTMKENVDIITLPKDILQAAKEKNIPLMVNVNMNGRTINWTFSIIDQIMDINLAMNIVNTKDVEALKNTDGLVFAFNHSGNLPTGTTITTYVEDTFKAGEKVQLSYYNEKTKQLEETKEYTVDASGNVSVVINHCSSYVLEKASIKEPMEESEKESEKEPVKESEKKSVKAPKTSGQNVNDIIKATSSGHASSISMVVLFSMVGGLIYFRKRNKAVK